jgi:hypothetical protein
MSEQSMNLTEAQLRELIAETVRATLTSIGVEVEDPIIMQKDFAHLRSWRESTEEIKRKSFIALVTIIVAGIAGAVWASLKGGGHP